ncbi:uncharacterized mitochondrial protein AtMg00810-like [Setaria viridis]|uniref:uncharacterized mitochondrial protein AtMg00810-like n=1 Tax=Setaria viridis TaxID=4556 RepID=UPI001493A2F5|nr:uncharacterized mitochondrial protein AtMg00810-like [Setaria viridis]
MVLTASTTSLLRHFVKRLRSAFAMKDMGPVHYFLGIDVKRNKDGFFLSQSQYAVELLERAGMSNCKPADTTADTKPKTSSTDGKPLTDGSSYRSMAGALQYLTITRPDLAYAVQQICLHMHSPRDCRSTMLKRVLRYVKGTTSFGIQLHASSSPTITAYTDADWRQSTVSLSSAEAEYRGIANAVAEGSWLRHLLGELHCAVPKATITY